MIASFPFIASSMDSDARTFCQVSNAQDRAAINFFVKGIKNLGLYDDMVCWPLRSAQNAGTGSTAYSLGGLGVYNGTLVNGPTWGVDGLSFAKTSSQYMEATTATSSPSSYLFGAVVKMQTSGFGGSVIFSHNGTSNADAVQTNDQASNALDGGHRQVAAATYIEPTDQSFTTDEFLFVQQGWTGSTVRRIKNKGNEQTAASNAFGGFISPYRLNSRSDYMLVGEDKIIAFSYLTLGAGADVSTCDAIYDLYKSTLGQGLGLP
jgi:hypothetical protein